jgi:protein-disulfide isomerase
MRYPRIAALAFCALLTIAARGNWNAQVVVSPSGSHVIGNPAAGTKLTEYVSYTCPHCAEFDRQASDPLRLIYVTSGKLSLEIRTLVRDPIDLTVAMLANCGPPAKFLANHTTFLRQQPQWLARAGSIGPAAQARWSSGNGLSRRRAIADDLGFYQTMQSRGYDRPATDRCLADDAVARRLAAGNEEAERLGVTGTPSFLINGELLAGTHDWQTLQAQLRARL